MRFIDLTDDREPRGIAVALFARFAPSRSGSVAAAKMLADQLDRSFGMSVDVIRLVMPGEPSAGAHPVVMDLNPHWHMSAHLAAQRANDCDIAVILLDRHVPPELIREFISELRVPVVLWIDDVTPVGSPETRVLAALAVQATRVIVPSEVARVRLETEAEHPLRVEVIAHGSAFSPMAPRPEPRRHILSWGFVGPGMGAERVIRALAQLHDMHPPPEFRLIGVTDPVWNRSEAEAYRSALMEEAERLGVADQVEIVPVHHSSEELASQIEECDLLVVAYDDTSRSASRILSEAISTGRPVIATAFPGAVEMLASGAGSAVAHDSDEDLEQALRRYLSDDESYRSAARTASSMSSRLGWDETARKLADLITELVDAAALVDENKH